MAHYLAVTILARGRVARRAAIANAWQARLDGEMDVMRAFRREAAQINAQIKRARAALVGAA